MASRIKTPLAACAALAAVAWASCAEAGARLFVRPLATASAFDKSLAQIPGVDASSVALGRSYMLSRLAAPGRTFVCTENETNATHVLTAVVSGLRSRENEFNAATYGHSTKTTVWSLDVIVSISSGGDILMCRSATGTYEERRPISESQFDNNIFHNLMVAATEQAADDVIEFFDGGDGASAAGGPTAVSSLPAAPRSGTVAPRPADPRPPLAILKPEAQAGVSDQEAMLLWDFLESSVQCGAFKLISRSDLVRMQEEIGFTTMSDLVSLSSQDRARIGRIKTVSKLLATSVGVVGETWVMSFKVFDASTAEIDTARSRRLTARSIDALLPQIQSVMEEIFAAPPSGTVLMPVKHPMLMPKSVAAAFDSQLAAALAKAGVAVKAGTEGAVRIVPSVSAFSVRAVSDGDGFVYRGSISGTVSVEGADAAQVVFSLADVELGRERGAAPSWLTQDYGEKLVSLALGSENVKASLAAIATADAAKKAGQCR